MSVALLFVLFATMPDIDRDQLLPDFTATTLLWLSGAVFFTLISVVLSTLRWQQVLAAFDQHPPVTRLLQHYFAGQFMANVLPSTVGGDVLRVGRLSRDLDDREVAFASVLLERLSGWLVLPAFTLFAFASNPGLRDLGRSTALAVSIALLTIFLLGVLVTLATSRRLGGQLVENEGMSRFIGSVHVGLDRFRRHPYSAVGVIAAGVAYQAALIIAAFMAARVIDIPEMGITATLAFIPAVATAQVLPIAISGLGVREGALVLFLTPLGVSTEQAVALGLLLYFLNLLVSLCGAPAFAVGARSTNGLAETEMVR